MYIPFSDIPQYLADTPVSALPGVGEAINSQLEHLGIHTCKDLRKVEKVCLSFSY